MYIIKIIDDDCYISTNNGILKSKLFRPPVQAILKIISTHYCYLLRSTSSNRTYFGYSTNVFRRLRQHNGEIKGGAKTTRTGRPWTLVCYISGFPDKVTSLQLEWRVHHPPVKRSGLLGRIKTIGDVLSLDQWTSNSPISSNLFLTIHWIEPYRLPHCPPYCHQINNNF